VDERGALWELDDVAVLQRPRDGGGERFARALVDDSKDLLERASERLRLGPTGQLLGDLG